LYVHVRPLNVYVSLLPGELGKSIAICIQLYLNIVIYVMHLV
jgi:hypothetical protein